MKNILNMSMEEAIDYYNSFDTINRYSMNDTLNIINEIKQKESNNILSKIKKDSYIFALDLKGKEYSSEQFANKIDNLSINTSNITFLIGGTLGMTNDLLNFSNESICFSKMTFPHPLIRVFLLEQLFRAFKISRGENYHH